MKNIQTKTILYFALLFSSILIIFSCENSTEPDESITTKLSAITIDWTDSNSIVCFGTSITAGQNNSDSTYPLLLGNELKIKVYNNGEWGNMASEGIEQFNTDVVMKNPALILLEFGANEFLRGFSLTTARNNIDLLIKAIKNKNIDIVFLNFLHPDMIGDTSINNPLKLKSDLAFEYYNMIKEVAKLNDIPLLEYIYKDIWGKQELLLSDGLHPNSLGNVQLKNNIKDALYSTFELNGMLK